MKIDSKIISIPPYVSVTWDQVSLIQAENEYDSLDKALVLVLHLKEGKEIRVPGLDTKTIELAFEAHRKYMEQKSENRKENSPRSPAHFIQQLIGLPPEQLNNMPIRFGISGPGIEEIAMQHNAQLANTPDLPEEVVEKIAQTAKLVTQGDLTLFPKPEAHCNCVYCQVARAIHGIEKNNSSQEEVVSDEELTFRDWIIEEVGQELYHVTNPLDANESYTVYLGQPVGCTCGESHCEHIRAVLLS